MAIVPDRTHTGSGGLAGIFGHPGDLYLGSVAPRQLGWTNRPVLGRGIGGHPFYNLVAWHQSRAYRDRGGRLPGGGGPLPGGGGPFPPRPPYNGGNPPRRNPVPPMPPSPVFTGMPGEQPIGPEQPQTAIYYNPQGAAAPIQHPALALARLLNG